MWKIFNFGADRRVEKAADEGLGPAAQRAVMEEISTLKGQIAALNSEVVGVRLEWAATYKKLSRLAGHITKAAAIDHAQQTMTGDNGHKPVNVNDLTREQIALL